MAPVFVDNLADRRAVIVGVAELLPQCAKFGLHARDDIRVFGIVVAVVHLERVTTQTSPSSS